MPINALSIGKAIRGPSPAERSDERTRRRTNALQLQSAEQSMADQNVLRELARSGIPLNELTQQYQAQTGDLGTSMALREKEITRIKEAADWLNKETPKVNEANYSVFKRRAEKLGHATPGALPETYDPEFMKRYRFEVQKAVAKPLEGAPGYSVVYDKEENIEKIIEPVKPTGKQFDVNFLRSAGLGDTEIANRLHPRPKPEKPSARDEQREAIIRSLPAMGITDPYAQEVIADGIIGETIVPDEYGQLKDAITGQPVDPSTFVRPGTRQNPYRPQTEEEFAEIPSGAVFIDPQDGQPYRKP